MFDIVNITLDLHFLLWGSMAFFLVFSFWYIWKLFSLLELKSIKKNLSRDYMGQVKIDFGLWRLFLIILFSLPVILVLELFPSIGIERGAVVMVLVLFAFIGSLFVAGPFFFSGDSTKVLQLKQQGKAFYITHGGQNIPVVTAKNYLQVHFSGAIKHFAEERYVVISYKKKAPNQFRFIVFPQKDERLLRHPKLAIQGLELKVGTYFSTKFPPATRDIQEIKTR